MKYECKDCWTELYDGTIDTFYCEECGDVICEVCASQQSFKCKNCQRKSHLDKTEDKDIKIKDIKIEDMPVTISYGENKVDIDRVYTIFVDIIKRIEKEKSDVNEKKAE